jgi:RNAse (barnase) inhibitor barstar
LAIIVFVYATLFLGEVGSFYERFWWWDIALHIGSAMAFGCIGFVIMYLLFKSNKLEANSFWLSVFTFCFAVSIGVIWEIFEFSMDQIFGMNMQKSGLIDTMWDLIVDSIGGLIASIAGYAFMKGNQRSYFSRLINIFIKDNPNLKV